MARPTTQLADIKALQELYASTSTYNNLIQVNMIRPVIVYTMRECGCTYAEISKVFGISRQMIETIYNNLKEQL